MFKISIYIAILISFFITFYNLKSAHRLLSKKERVLETQKRLEDLTLQNANLKKELEYKKSDEFVIKEAREKLNYTFEGEKIVVFPNEDLADSTQKSLESFGVKEETKDTLSKQEASLDPNYILWFKSFFY